MNEKAHSPNKDSHTNERQQEGMKKKKSWFKKWKTILALIWILGLYNTYKQDKVNEEHASLDFIFKPEDMTTQEMLKYLVITPEYSNNTKKWLSRHWIPLEGNTDSYSIFVNLKDHKTIQDKKKAINELREKQSRPILISTDFEWWYVHAIDELTDEEIEKYWVPKRILELRDQEDNWKNKVSAFPSAEFLGKLYEKIVFNWTHKERLDFLIMMQKYGESIRKIMEDIWVDIVFWPCVDIVPDFDGDTPIAKNDRSFWENFILAQDLISSFVNWFQDPGSHVLLVPKHYVSIWGSEDDPHNKLSKVDKNKNNWTETIFNNLINGVNDQLDQKKNNKFIISYNNSKDKDQKYWEILEKNKWFINYLNKQGESLSEGEEIISLMTTHAHWLWWISETITYSAKIIDRMKNNVWKTNKMKDWIVFSDDLDMKGASIWLPEWVENYDNNKIWQALASGHDVVMDLWWISNDVFEELADSIDNGFDINNDWKIDLTRDMLYEKIKKVLEISVKKWELEKTNWRYMLNNATYFDPSIWKAIRDAFYSNQWPISWSGIKEYKAEWNWISDMLIKKWKSLYEYFIHNWPNAVRKVWKLLLKKLRWSDEYRKALEQWKKLVIVDKSECQMFIFSIDGKELLESHDVGVWKWTAKLDYKHDRRILWDDKTPVGYYLVVDRAMWWDELRERWLNNVWWYWWENWGLIALVGGWTPYEGIHWTQWNIWPSSNACVRVLDPSEDGEWVDKSKQIAINHINKILPDGSFVIITN